MVFDLLQVFAQAIHTFSIAAQYTSNKTTKSIYGLSFDLLLFTFADALLAISIFLLSLLHISTEGYNLRYPVNDLISQATSVVAIPLSVAVFFLNILQIGYCYFIVVRQVLTKFRHTRHVDQGVSLLAMALVSSGLLVILMYCKWLSDKQHNDHAITGKYGLVWVDFIELLYLMRSFCSTVKLFPQVGLNFSTLQPFGLSSLTVKLELSACLVTLSSSLMFKPSLSGLSYNDMYLIPLNYQSSVLAAVLQVGSCLIVMYQVSNYPRKKVIALKFLDSNFGIEDENANQNGMFIPLHNI